MEAASPWLTDKTSIDEKLVAGLLEGQITEKKMKQFLEQMRHEIADILSHSKVGEELDGYLFGEKNFLGEENQTKKKKESQSKNKVHHGPLESPEEAMTSSPYQHTTEAQTKLSSFPFISALSENPKKQSET